MKIRYCIENFIVVNKRKPVEQRLKILAQEFSKKDLSDIIIEALRPIQDEYNNIINDKSQLDSILTLGRDKARYIANKTLSKVYRKVGLIAKPR